MGPIQVHKKKVYLKFQDDVRTRCAQLTEISDLLPLSLQTDVWLTENQVQNKLGNHQVWYSYPLDNKDLKSHCL